MTTAAVLELEVERDIDVIEEMRLSHLGAAELRPRGRTRRRGHAPRRPGRNAPQGLRVRVSHRNTSIHIPPRGFHASRLVGCGARYSAERFF